MKSARSKMERLINKTLEYIKACMESDGAGTFGITLSGDQYNIFLPENEEELTQVYDWMINEICETEDAIVIYVNLLNVRGMASDRAVGLLCWDGQRRETRIYPYSKEDGVVKFFDPSIFEGHLVQTI